MSDLPRPKVEVTHQTSEDRHQVDVVISRDNKAKSYSGTGTMTEAIQGVVRGIIDDRSSGEWLP